MGKGAGETPSDSTVAHESIGQLTAELDNVKIEPQATGPATTPEAKAAKSILDRLTGPDAAAREAAATELDSFVQKTGNIKHLEAANFFGTIEDALATKADQATKVNTLSGIAGVCKTVGRACEPFIVPLLTPVLLAAGDKAAEVRTAADAAGVAIMAITSEPAIKSNVMPLLLNAMAPRQNWQTKLAANVLFVSLTERFPEGVAQSLPEVVPAISQIMNDAKPQVKKAANKSLNLACGALNNKDIKPFIPVLVTCLANPAEVPQCVHKLASTTFVQAVESPELAMMAPLLLKGLAVQQTTPIKRKSALIVDNMAKLVEQPAHAAVFLPNILPLVTRVSNEVSNPECREVATQAVKTLTQLKTELDAVTKANEDITTQAVLDIVAKLAGFASHADIKGSEVTALTYAADLCFQLTVSRIFRPAEWTDNVVPFLAPYIGQTEAHAVAEGARTRCKEAVQKAEDQLAGDEEAEEGEDLCDCEFSLAYGAKILLNNAKLHLKRGKIYGLCGPNGAGKSTLMRAISNGQVDGFPPPEELRTVYVEHDIDASESEQAVLEFIHNDPILQGATHPDSAAVESTLKSLGFSDTMISSPVGALSGGWKMKLALARAMLMKADIMLLDEPTNHLDVTNVAWLVNYITHLPQVTSMVVSHDSGFLDKTCSHIIHYENRKLKTYRGNLSEFVRQKPEAQSYYQLDASPIKFILPEPGFLEGIKSKDRAILKMNKVNFTYPNTTRQILHEVTIQCSLNSRIAILGPNGAGKSTMVKLLTGELLPDAGVCWKHPNMRVAYVAQHAFHHIETHLDMTPNEYIRWRYAMGEDRESVEKMSRQQQEEDEKALQQQIKTDDGIKRILDKLLGRRKAKRSYEYEVQWKNSTPDQNSWYGRDKLEEMGFSKLVNDIDAKEAARLGLVTRPLTEAVVQKHLEDLGLEAAFGTHSQMRGLSGGQKVKVVIAAAMWNNPHILVLDEPTNYLDRDSLGALAGAIKEYGGGIVMITHNREFSSALCPESWDCKDGRLVVSGQSEAAKNEAKLEMKRQETYIDALGNEVKIKAPKKVLSRAEKKKAKKVREMKRARGEEVSDTDEDEV